MNFVDLNNCYSHQSYYTALSHSTSAAGTIILQGFDTKKITGGVGLHAVTVIYRYTVPVMEQPLVLSHLILSTMPLPSYQINYLTLI